jgi:hypothetical protein
VIVIRSPEDASRVADSAIRTLVETRFAQITAGEPYDPGRHGYMILVEPGDKVDAIEKTSGCPVLRNSFDDAHFGDAEFSPAAEIVEEHRGFFELVYLFSDSGDGVVQLFVPKAEGVDLQLLAMCAQFATPPVAPTPP